MDETPEVAPDGHPIYESNSQGNFFPLLLFIVGSIVAIALIVAFVGFIRHWLAVHTGVLHAGPDIYYNFWSGIGSDFGEASLVTGIWVIAYTVARKVNCHEPKCWRIGHHPLEGTPYTLCKHHHPHVRTKGLTHQDIVDHHKRYIQQKELTNK